MTLLILVAFKYYLKFTFSESHIRDKEATFGFSKEKKFIVKIFYI